MIQFNLLPDIKIHYLKAKRQKHVVILVAVIASVTALAVFILLLVTVFALQKKNISDLNKDIKTSSEELQSVPELNKILTVQSQLGTLGPLHDKKVVSSQLLGYITQVTPAAASISKLEVDYALNTMKITGSAPDSGVVNTFTDTLKFTTYATSDNSNQKNAFSNVALLTFSRDAKAATYEIDLKFDPVIFGNAKQVVLNVPKIVTTRSQTAKPTETFQKAQ